MSCQPLVVCSFCRGQDICNRYDYTVEFSGIGDPPTESQHVGYCSQAAIFTSSSPRKVDVDIDHANRYSLVSTKIWKVMKIFVEKKNYISIMLDQINIIFLYKILKISSFFYKLCHSRKFVT